VFFCRSRETEVVEITLPGGLGEHFEERMVLVLWFVQLLGLRPWNRDGCHGLLMTAMVGLQGLDGFDVLGGPSWS